MLQLVLGPSGTGKSSWLFERVRERAVRGEKSLVLVPEQFTSSTESRIYNTLGDELSGFAASYSFSSLAEKILATYGGAAVRTLTDAGRAVLVRRALEAMGDRLVYYSRHRRSTAFCEKCAETLDELKSAGLTAAELERLARAAGPGREKLAELAGVFAAYEALLEGAAMDPSDRVLSAAEVLEPGFLEGRAVFIDEFDTFNAPKRRLLERILQFAPETTVALCCDGLDDAEGGLGLFSGAKKMALALRQSARKNGVAVASPVVLTTDWRHSGAPDLARLALLLEGGSPAPGAASPAQLTLSQAETRAGEAKRVAAAIDRLARQGVAYGKMAVICRESEAYLTPLRYEFRLAGIPFFFDEPTTAEHAAPIRLVRALLDLVRRGLSSERLLAVAKTGLTQLPEEQLCALENYAYTWQLSAAQWREPFTLSPAGFGAEMRPEDARQLELAEEARAWLVPILDRYAKAGREKPAEALCALTYRTMQALGGEDQVGAAAERLKQAEGIPAAEEAIRVWNLASELLDQMALLLGEETLPAAECGELFELLARTTDLGHIPQSLDAVILTTAGRMRLDNPEWCFVLGLGEGEFPKAPGESGLLTHTERDSLIRQGVDMPDCFENRTVREQVCFYKALTAPSKGLWLSWAAGPGALPVTSALAPVVELLAPGRPDLSIADLTGTPAAALDVLGQTWDPESPATAALYGAVEAAPGGPEQLAPVRRAASAEPYKVRDKAAMRRLLGRDLWLSPSKMERYYSCPFSYFMEYVLNARPRRQAALTADQSGNLVHYVLEQALARAGEGFVDMTEDELARLAAGVAEEYVKENMPGGAARFGYLVRRLERSAASLLCYIQAEQRQGSFVPVAFELGIGGKEGEVPPVTLTTAGGETVRMVGKIDRVDAYKEGGKTWLRVVDYKTGSKEFLLEDVRNGLNCQMLIYLFTLTRNGNVRFENPAPAGVLYLMADPAPARESREKAAKGLEYQVEGMVVQDEAVLRAMDRDATGLYVPLKFDKAGHPKLTEALASLSGLAELQNEMDSLVLRMAQNLYEGEIAVEPLARGKRGETHCEWCDYRSVCRRQDD
ncbi:PD-(D/E)XK nuclease family protein [Allofournierella sp.]|uniref:PD-(D/E)XK nuclease family protein n=1 Tax=Allofournierella sp. TaxID=1940256 RepID=UPI003AB1370B